MTKAASSHLPAYLAAGYLLLAAYGSLYPFSDWHDSGVPLTAFLAAGWPRYLTTFDLASNVAAYLPLGFLWFTAFRTRVSTGIAAAATVLLGAAVSLGLEMLQNYLPSRVPSNLDLACNVAGTALGTLAGARWGAVMLDGGRLHALRLAWFRHGPIVDGGLMLIWLWLLTQLNPDTLLFGNGSLRQLFELPAALPFSAAGFVRIEAAIVAAQTVAIGLIAIRLARRWQLATLTSLLAAGLLAKSFAFWLLMQGSQAVAWATPGSVAGLGIGYGVCLAARALPSPWQTALAAFFLLLGTTLVNLAPENPYLANTFQVWDPGHFLNFHGLTRLASALWPFLVLPWLMLLKTERQR